MNKITALNALAAACVAAGTPASVTDGKLIVAGRDMTSKVYVKETDTAMRKRNAWDRSVHVPVYTYTVEVTGTGGRCGIKGTKLPLKKDGSYSWDRGAELLATVARVDSHEASRQSISKTNEPVVAALREELGLSEWDQFSLRVSASAERPVALSFKTEGAVTVERARELHAILKAAGFLK